MLFVSIVIRMEEVPIFSEVLLNQILRGGFKHPIFASQPIHSVLVCGTKYPSGPDSLGIHQ